MVGANTVKYTTPYLCIGLSESESKLYIIFKFCEGRSHKHLEKHIDLQSQAIYGGENIKEKSLYFGRRCK
jgi:hypothetical protein